MGGGEVHSHKDARHVHTHGSVLETALEASACRLEALSPFPLAWNQLAYVRRRKGFGGQIDKLS